MIAFEDQPDRNNPPELKDLPEELEDQLRAAGISDEDHEMFTAAVTGRVRNPVDHMGRTPHEVSRMKAAGFLITPKPKCSLCGERLIHVCECNRQAGSVRTTHFRHTGNSKCPGGYVTPWHLGMQRGAKNLGLATEWGVEVDGAKFRIDAYSQANNVALEFVHSLSAAYVGKHKRLVSCGTPVRWIFNSRASFATNNWEEFVDPVSLANGQVLIGDLVRAAAADLIDELGWQNCFIYYRNVILSCVGRDLWTPLPATHPIQRLCTSDYGFNHALEAMAMRNIRTVDGKEVDEPRKVRTRFPIILGRYDHEYFLEYIRKDVVNEKYNTTRSQDLSPAVSPEAGDSDAMPKGEVLERTKCDTVNRTNLIGGSEAAEILAGGQEAPTVSLDEGDYVWRAVAEPGPPSIDVINFEDEGEDESEVTVNVDANPSGIVWRAPSFPDRNAVDVTIASASMQGESDKMDMYFREAGRPDASRFYHGQFRNREFGRLAACAGMTPAELAACPERLVGKTVRCDFRTGHTGYYGPVNWRAAAGSSLVEAKVAGCPVRIERIANEHEVTQ